MQSPSPTLKDMPGYGGADATNKDRNTCVAAPFRVVTRDILSFKGVHVARFQGHFSFPSMPR